MKFKTNNSKIRDHFSFVSQIVPPKSTLPILSNFLLRLKGDVLYVTSMDMDVNISVKVQVDGFEDGTTMVPAKLLTNLLLKLDDEELTFAIKGEKLILNCGKKRYTFSCDDPADFPVAFEDKKEFVYEIGTDVFREMIGRCLFAASVEIVSRPILTGILIRFLKNELIMVATDATCLSKVKIDYKNEKLKDVVCSSRMMNLLLKGLIGDRLKISLSENNAVFYFGNYRISSRLLEGEYPDYENVFPENNDKIVKVDRETLMGSVERISLFSDSDMSRLNMKVSDGNMVLSCVEETNSGHEELAAVDFGDDVDVNFGMKSFVELVRNVKSEEIDFRFGDSKTVVEVLCVDDKLDSHMLIVPFAGD